MIPSELTTRAGPSAFKEAALIVVASILLATAYNAVMGKGVFGTNQAPSEAKVPVDEVPPTFIMLEEAVAAFNAKQTLFVDARHEYDYGLGHIKGAINIPLKEFETRTDIYGSWPKDTILIVYCDGAECNSSIDLAKKFSAAGFTKVNIFFGGWSEWQMHNNPGGNK